jgi:hypothetical protein
MRLNTSIRHTSLHYNFYGPAWGSLGGHKWGSLKWPSGEPMEIPGIGHFISFMDTENNRVSMLQPFPREELDQR